jgi:hypothetical protein
MAARWLTLGNESSAEVDRDVAGSAARRDRVAEDHAGDGPEPAGALVTTALFELPQGMQQLRRSDLFRRTIAKRGIVRLEQPAVLLQGRLRPLLAPMLVQELLGDLAETVAAGGAGHLLIGARWIRRWRGLRRPIARGLSERYLG